MWGQARGDELDSKRIGWVGEQAFIDAFAPSMGNATKLLTADKSGLLNLNFTFRAPNIWGREIKFLNGNEYYVNSMNWLPTSTPTGAFYAFYTGTNSFVSSYDVAATGKPFKNYNGLEWTTPVLYAGQIDDAVSEHWLIGNPEEGIYPQLQHTLHKWIKSSANNSQSMASNRNIGYEIVNGNPKGSNVLLADAITINEVFINGGVYYNGSVFAKDQGSMTSWYLPTKNYSSYAFVSKGDNIWIRNTWTSVRSYAYVCGCQITSNGLNAICPWICKISGASIY